MTIELWYNLFFYEGSNSAKGPVECVKVKDDASISALKKAIKAEWGDRFLAPLLAVHPSGTNAADCSGIPF